jgi:excisionase family DNA binding protein
MSTNDSEVLTLGEAATYLRVHRRTMNRLLRQGVVPGTKIGRQWRIRRTDLDQVFMAEPRQEPQANGSAGTTISVDRSAR